MMRKHAAIPAILGALLIFPSGALADGAGGDNGGRHDGGLDVRVRADSSGCRSTDVDVRRFTVGPEELPAVQVTATPEENRPLGPLDISVNAQVAVLQVLLRTNDVAILDNVNVGITQGNGPGAGGTPTDSGGAPTDSSGSPPGNGANPPANPSGINITVNAQVAVVQVIVGTNNDITLKNVNVNINQGNQVTTGT
jgi:hypothetical protein